MNKIISLRRNFPQYYHLLLGKTFSFTSDEAKVEGLAKASVPENN